MKILNLNNFFIKFLLFACVLLVACIFMFKGCDDDVTYTNNDNDSLKLVIANQNIIKDSLLAEVKKKDTIRVEVIKKYRILKHDTIYANICAPIIQLCDSIILIDSSLIVDLKHVIKVDSVIIGNYKKVTHNDSLSIVGLNKEVKKQKRQKKWLIVWFVGLGVVAAVK